MFFEELKEGLIVFLVSMAPGGGARFAIPLGVAGFHMPPLLAFAWGVLGNIVVTAILLKYLEPMINWIFAHSPFLTRHVKKYLDKMHKRHSEKFNRRGAILLTTFAAIPSPATGAWSASALAYLFNIPFPLAFTAISFGEAIAAAILAFSTEAIMGILSVMQA